MEDKNNGISTTLSEKQIEFLKENFRKMSEQELFQKIQEIDPETDEKTFAEGSMRLLQNSNPTCSDRKYPNPNWHRLPAVSADSTAMTNVKSRNINTALTTARISFNGIFTKERFRTVHNP